MEKMVDDKLFNKIFENAPMIMAVVDSNVTIEKINHALSEAVRKPQEDILGLLGGELLGCINSYKSGGCGKQQECKGCVVRETVAETIQTSKDVYKKEGELTIKTGDDISTRSLVVSTTFIESNKQQRVLITIDDMTDQKLTEKELKRKKEELEVASRAKSDFLARMSHELRTPLNSVIGFSDLLMTESYGQLNDKQLKYAQNISTSGKHLLGLINDVLDISKIEAGKMNLIYSPIFVPYVINETVQTLMPLASKKDIELISTIDKDVDTLHADEAKFKQILYNLLGNAIKFTPENGKIELKAAMADNALSVSIKDNGIGIPLEKHEVIFDAFIQADDSIQSGYGSTGLGLPLVRKFVKMHDGEIHLESEPGKGSTFTFTIPIDTRTKVPK